MAKLDLREHVFTLLSQNQPEVVILQLNQLLKTSPENSQALALKAYALNRLANLSKEWKYSESALECASRALLINPDNDIALTSKGWAQIDLGQAGEALPVLEQATQVNPANEYAWYNLAWAQYLVGDAVASTVSLKRALALAPGNQIIRRGKELMERGEVPNHLKKLAK
jgi:tetratricopeptide (TPR) repeat protein